MPVFLCRWPNGEFSIVSARTRDDAVFLLDEWGNAEQARIRRLDDCMFDFRLADDGEIELSQIGERTLDSVMTFCYPHLDEAFATAESDKDGYTEQGRETIRQTVAYERVREWDTQPAPKPPQKRIGDPARWPIARFGESPESSSNPMKARAGGVTLMEPAG